MKSPGLRLLLCFILLASAGRLVRASSSDGLPGVAFFKGSWKDALAEAKRQNKPIFLDVFTSWCPPCKRMAKEAFPNVRVGTKFNTLFINYQVDAEKGEGVAIAKQYAVASYPTALYLTPDGGLVHRSVGYGGVNAMIDQADLVLAIPQLKVALVKGDKEYANGKRDPAFLKRYLKARQALNRATNDVLDAYLDVLPEPERTTPETLLFICDAIQSSNTKAFDYLIKNRPSLLASDLAKQSLARAILSATYRTLDNEFNQACATNDETLLETVITGSEQNTTSSNPFLKRQEVQQLEAATEYRLRFYRATKNIGKYRAIAGPVAQNQFMSQSVSELKKMDSVSAVRLERNMALLPDSLKKLLPGTVTDKPITSKLVSFNVAYALHEMANAYLELGTSSADWEPALTWAERAIVLYRRPEYVNTYTGLLKKLGRSTDAPDVQK